MIKQSPKHQVSLGILLRNLVLENPMIVEVTRFRKRFLAFGANPITNTILALMIVFYISIIFIIIAGNGEIPPIALVIAQTVLFTFAAPALLHASIAGERERRSWDLLLVAPISKAQIVVGKFMGALSALSVAFFLLAIPIGLSFLIALGRTNVAGFFQLILAEMLSLSFAVMVCSFSMLISARVKRNFMSLGITLGSLFVLLAVIPGLVASMMGGDRISMEFFLIGHPIYALAHLMETLTPNVASTNIFPMVLYGIPHVLIYSSLSVVMLGWTINTLNFAENEVKFLPKAKAKLNKKNANA